MCEKSFQSSDLVVCNIYCAYSNPVSVSLDRKKKEGERRREEEREETDAAASE